MPVDSLVELKSVFDTWRHERKHVREPTPRGLIERAMRAASVHGPSAVRGATGISARHHLAPKPREVQQARRPKGDVTIVPTFSRVELSAPIALGPLAEVETPSGMKLRIFTATTETLGLVNALCSKECAP